MKNKGFTLIELVVVFGIISVVGVSGFSVYKVWQNSNKLENGSMVLVASLREARNNAWLGKNDSDWGVKYTNNELIIFSGSNYSNREDSMDIVFDLPIGVLIDGLEELIFYKFTGSPSEILNIKVIYGEKDLEISFNEFGVFDY